ncbi:putative Acid ceramidase-like protein, partial [Naja naja]
GIYKIVPGIQRRS